MRCFVNRYRKSGLAFLAAFALQVIAVGFCSIPSVHAAPATGHTSVDMQCTMDMSAGQGKSDCSHCKTPDFNTFSNQADNAPATWALIAVLPTLLHQVGSASEQEQSLFIVSEAPPRSSSLIYQKTLRIRL